MLRRDFVGGLSGCAGLLLADVGAASYARAVSLAELLHYSDFAVVGTAERSTSKWAYVGKTRRVVTYTELKVQQSIDGRPPRTRKLTVRTLGGRVGDIGQVVHGEARLFMKRPHVVFLTPVQSAVFRVTAMAQGHFPLLPDGRGDLRLRESPNLPDLLKPAKAAARLLTNRTIPEAEELILRELHQSDP